MNGNEWKIPYSWPEIPASLRHAGYGPLLSAILALRGLCTQEEARALLYGGPECLHDPLDMNGMAVARSRLLQAIKLKETVAVYGDYDVDGITATCLVTDYLRGKGLRCLSYIPDRSEEGYGLNCAALDALRSDGVRLVITVDCGITAVEEADYARSVGIDMIITDHHECKTGELPDAVAVIDSKQEGNTYPNPHLAGVGVALKLVSACEGSGERMLERYGDLVAVGTVADVVPLIGENRYLVRQGLKKLTTDPLPGFAAMCREAGVDPASLNAATIGFSLAPRLNAAGRLGQAGKTVDLLMCRDPREASVLAAELCELNRQRQSIETEIWKDAQARLAGTTPQSPIVLASDQWHQGVIGIAASRLAEQFGLPAVMICLSGEQGKGSCRSYGGFNLYDALSACSEHLLGFGGHALAAGLTIRRDQVDAFRAAFAAYYLRHCPPPQPEVQCDLHLKDGELLTIENVRELDLLEPFGSANPKPVFCLTGALLESADEVGGGRHLRYRLQSGSCHLEGIFFGHTAKELGLREGDAVDLAFTPQINDYRGHVSVQLHTCAMRPHRPEALCRAILENDLSVTEAASPYCPERRDFVRIWKERGGRIVLGKDLESVLNSCPEGMPPERYCICLMALLETGLLQGEHGIYGARSAEIEGKADLEATRIIQRLRAQRHEEQP